MNASTIRIFTLAAVLALSLVGCAASAGAADPSSPAAALPTWVLEPQEAYPSVRYITAVGSGRSLDEAERDAHDKLGRRFRVLLDASETQREAYQSTTGSTLAERDGADWERSTSLLSTVRLSTNEQLLNAQIVERYHGSDGRYYALGALERLPTARLYAEQMRINADLALTHYQAAQAAPAEEKLKRLAHLRTAESAARSYYALAHIHDVLSGMGGRDLLPGAQDPDLAAIQAAHDEAQHSFAVGLTWTASVPAALRAQLQRAVNGAGLSVAQRGGDVTLELDYDVSLLTIARYNLVRADWRLTISVRDGRGEQIATIIYDERDGGRDEAAARLQAQQRAAQVLSERLPGDVFQALYNEQAEHAD